MNYSNLFLMAILVLSCGAYDTPNASDLVQRPVIGAHNELYFTGPISVESEQQVQKYMLQAGIVEPIIVVQPSRYLCDMFPGADFVTLLPNRTLVVNDEWFGQLSQPEQRFIILSTLSLLAEPEPDTIHAPTVALQAGFGLTSLALGVATWWYLNKKGTLAGYDMNWWKKILGSVTVMGLFELCIEYPFFAVYNRYNGPEPFLKKIVRKYDCLDGALAYHKRWKGVLEEHRFDPGMNGLYQLIDHDIYVLESMQAA